MRCRPRCNPRAPCPIARSDRKAPNAASAARAARLAISRVFSASKLYYSGCENSTARDRALVGERRRRTTRSPAAWSSTTVTTSNRTRSHGVSFSGCIRARSRSRCSRFSSPIARSGGPNSAVSRDFTSTKTSVSPSQRDQIRLRVARRQTVIARDDRESLRCANNDAPDPRRGGRARASESIPPRGATCRSQSKNRTNHLIARRRHSITFPRTT